MAILGINKHFPGSGEPGPRGNDIIAVSRTAWDASHRAHDANYLTFHRVPDFRRRTAQDPPLP